MNPEQQGVQPPDGFGAALSYCAGERLMDIADGMTLA
tara:strand:- start:55417 stop:55527 length:111 start_codon:yes stop_codon:yes gene_type:complete